MKKVENKIIKNWYATIDDTEKFLDFAEGLNINEFVIERGERAIYLEDGIHYIAHGERIGELDGARAKAIIDTLEECGVEFKEKSNE